MQGVGLDRHGSHLGLRSDGQHRIGCGFLAACERAAGAGAGPRRGEAAGLRAQGAQIAVADLDRPETLSDDLLDGVTGVYFVTWNGPTALQQSRNLLETITRSGKAPHVVRLSGYGTLKSRIISELAKCEDELKDSGLPWTILKPTFFMQNVMMAVPTVRDQGHIYFDWGNGKAGMIDVRDVVDCAVGALTGDTRAIDGETFILTGPASIGFADVAAKLSDVVGRPVQYMAVPHEAAIASMTAMGVPQWIAEGYGELDEGFEHGFADLTTQNVHALSGHQPRDFERFARDFAQFFTPTLVPTS